MNDLFHRCRRNFFRVGAGMDDFGMSSRLSRAVLLMLIMVVYAVLIMPAFVVVVVVMIVVICMRMLER